jgi:hypothetical protein
MRRFRFLLISLTIVLLAVAALAAPNAGSISGRVVDRSTKQPIAGVSIQIMGTSTGMAADPEGAFSFRDLPENVYRLRVSCIGYENLLVTDVRVVRGKITTVEVELPPAQLAAEGITVTAGLFKDDATAPVSNYGYSREEINRNPGAAGDVFRAIEALPGVSSSGGDFSAFSVRGGSPRDNIVLVDNIPFDKVSHMEFQQEDQEAQGGRFSLFAPRVISEARFQAGGFSSRYGGKNASLVDLSIKEGSRKSFTADGTYDLMGWEVNYDGPTYLLGSTSLLVSARHQDFERVMKMVGEEAAGFPSFSDVIVKTATEVNPRNKVWLLGIYAPEKYLRDKDNIYTDEDLKSTKLYYKDEVKKLAGVNWRLLTSKSSFLYTIMWYRQYDSKYTEGRVYVDPINGVVPSKEQAPERNPIYDISDKSGEAGVKSDFTIDMSAGATITTGVEISRVAAQYAANVNGWDTLYTFDETDFRPDTAQKFVLVNPDEYSNRFDAALNNAAAYCEYSRLLFDKATVNSGLRYEYSEANKKSYLSPRMSAGIALTKRTRLNLAAGIYYRAPELKEIVSDHRNRNLESERAAHIILGVSHYLRGDLRLTIETYYKNLENLVVRPDRASERRTNQGEGWARGVDVSLIKRLEDKFYGQVNYSYSQSKRDDNNGEGSYNSDFNQPHIFNILFGYQFNKAWSVAARWKYATGLPKDDYVVHADVHDDPEFIRYSREIIHHNTKRFVNYQSLNVRLDYRLQISRVAIVSFLDIMNLYNHENVSDEEFLPRSGTLDAHSIGITPTIGVKIEL